LVSPVDAVESFSFGTIDPKLDGRCGNVKFIGNALKGFVATIGGDNLATN
jgi:hypothetical protein